MIESQPIQTTGDEAQDVRVWLLTYDLTQAESVENLTNYWEPDQSDTRCCVVVGLRYDQCGELEGGAAWRKGFQVCGVCCFG